MFSAPPAMLAPSGLAITALVAFLPRSTGLDPLLLVATRTCAIPLRAGLFSPSLFAQLHARCLAMLMTTVARPVSALALRLLITNARP